MQSLEEVENIFSNLRTSSITEKDAQEKLSQSFLRLNKEEAMIMMKKMDKYQYEKSLQKTVYVVCPILYDFIKERD